MINSIEKFIKSIKNDLEKWDKKVKPWFRGESDDEQYALCPKIKKENLSKEEENYLLQSFRRKAGGLANVPPRSGHTDMWLFLAQHYGIPTRLLDWTEGALNALYFAINKDKNNSVPRVYMLNPYEFNALAGLNISPPNFPLSWVGAAELYVAHIWQNKLTHEQESDADKYGLDLKRPIAIPTIYQDQRMIAQRSCFTIHGKELEPIRKIPSYKKNELAECLKEYKIDNSKKTRITLLRELSILGISAASIFPDLDNIAKDLRYDVKLFKPDKRQKPEQIVV